MNLSMLMLAAVGLALVLYTSHHGQASELGDLLEDELSKLGDEIVEKRGRARRPCGFTWKCGGGRKRRGRRIWGKRSEINRQTTSVSAFSQDDIESLVRDYVIDELKQEIKKKMK